MKLAFSPCPNDTFLFHPWVHGMIESELDPEPELADLATLNRWAGEGGFPLIKVSFHALGHLLDHYQALPVGAAIGPYGPKLIAREGFPLDQLESKRVALPGRLTTAHLLLQLLCPQPAMKRFCRYNEVTELINLGHVDAGVIIHEQRFTYASQGFVEVCDLGEMWEGPVPLGCLAVRRDFPHIPHLTEILRTSLQISQCNPNLSRPYVLHHAQEKDPAIIRDHINAYVTSETVQISSDGGGAVSRLFEMARERHLLPPVREWLAA